MAIVCLYFKMTECYARHPLGNRARIGDHDALFFYYLWVFFPLRADDFIAQVGAIMVCQNLFLLPIATQFNLSRPNLAAASSSLPQMIISSDITHTSMVQRALS